MNGMISRRCSFPPHYTTYAGSGIPCPACNRSEEPAPALSAELKNRVMFFALSELVGALSLVLAFALLAGLLIGGRYK